MKDYVIFGVVMGVLLFLFVTFTQDRVAVRNCKVACVAKNNDILVCEKACE